MQWSMLQRWGVLLTEYGARIEYRKGKNNVRADYTLAKKVVTPNTFSETIQITYFSASYVHCFMQNRKKYILALLAEIQAPLDKFYYVNHQDLAWGINMLIFYKLSNITMSGS